MPTLSKGRIRSIQQLICQLVSIRGAGKFKDSKVEFMLDANVGFDEKNRLYGMKMRPRFCSKTLFSIDKVLKAIEFFKRLLLDIAGYIDENFNRKLNTNEVHRVERALWRFEVCCALADSWESCGDVDVVQSGQDSRLFRMTKFLKRFRPWELEELVGVYEFLELAMFHYGTERCSCHPKGLLANTNLGGSLDLELTEECKRRWKPQLHVDFDAVALYWTRDAAASHTGIFAPFGNDLPLWAGNEMVDRTTMRSRFLSQGLNFLGTFQQQPFSFKMQNQENLQTCPFGDEFIFGALFAVSGWNRTTFPREELQQNESDACPWDDCHGAHVAGPLWSPWCNFLSRSFKGVQTTLGRTIWDDLPTSSRMTLEHFYGQRDGDKCREGRARFRGRFPRDRYGRR